MHGLRSDGIGSYEGVRWVKLDGRRVGRKVRAFTTLTGIE